ncbi:MULTISPECIES: hypothetical protein [Pseudomonas]|jgi:membrane-bound ClpP family serine protease|uniref:Uncharacterized protein n=1 Tax=Pseudomonas rhizophila TaxID=2045200 RepID=A0ABN5JPJ0_9PSED|nr:MULTISPECIES: hypothetical protein [Pseudomonas]AVU74217.1 hypothetical protein CRX69_03035 [Pseudomonas rhizophila]QKJ37659.1 hypothetical protein HQ912_23595 [Pseudomonas sp. MPDS]
MNEFGLYALAYVVFLLLFFYMKSYGLRKWLGIALVALGFASIFTLPSFVSGFDLGIASTSAIGIGAALFFSRARYVA